MTFLFIGLGTDAPYSESLAIADPAEYMWKMQEVGRRLVCLSVSSLTVEGGFKIFILKLGEGIKVRNLC